jgi:hypothetical protein
MCSCHGVVVVLEVSRMAGFLGGFGRSSVLSLKARGAGS